MILNFPKHCGVDVLITLSLQLKTNRQRHILKLREPNLCFIFSAWIVRPILTSKLPKRKRLTPFSATSLLKWLNVARICFCNLFTYNSFFFGVFSLWFPRFLFCDFFVSGIPGSLISCSPCFEFSLFLTVDVLCFSKYRVLGCSLVGGVSGLWIHMAADQPCLDQFFENQLRTFANVCIQIVIDKDLQLSAPDFSFFILDWLDTQSSPSSVSSVSGLPAWLTLVVLILPLIMLCISIALIHQDRSHNCENTHFETISSVNRSRKNIVWTQDEYLTRSWRLRNLYRSALNISVSGMCNIIKSKIATTI